MFKKFVLQLFRESLVEPRKYSFAVLGSISYVLNKLDRILVKQVGYPKVKQSLQVFFFLIGFSINPSYKETVLLKISEDQVSIRLSKFRVFLHNKVPIVDTQVFKGGSFQIGHYKRCFLMFLFKLIRSIINIDLDLIKVFFKFTRVTIKFRQGYDLNRSLKTNVVIKGHFDVPILVFSLLN